MDVKLGLLLAKINTDWRVTADKDILS